MTKTEHIKHSNIYVKNSNHFCAYILYIHYIMFNIYSVKSALNAAGGQVYEYNNSI